MRGLWVLAKLGFTNDPRTQDAINLLKEKRLLDGRWMLEKTPSGRMMVSIGTKASPNKWVTLLAFEVLLKIGKIEI